jgi:hypothetical protein
VTDWTVLGLIAAGGVVLTTHVAGVAFVVGRIVFSGHPRQRQWSPK